MNPSDPLGLGGFNTQALHPSDEAMQSGAMPSRPAHAQTGQGGIAGFLERNAPTIGGIIGGVAALPANLLDAVTGVGGTALDVGAASAGTALGQRIKNHFTGDTTSTLKEGLIGGASELAGEGAGKVIGKGVGAAKNALTGTIAKQTEDKALQSGYDQFSKVKPQVLQDNDLNGTMQDLKNLNLPQNTQGMHTYHDTMTGDEGVASGTMRQILSNAPDVNVGTVINDDVTKAVRSHGIGDTMKRGSQANQLLSDIRDTVTSKLFPDGSITGKANANDVFDMIQHAGAQKARFAGAEPGTFAAAQHDAWATVKNNLEDKLYNDGGVDKAVSDYKLAPEDEAYIRKTTQAKGGSDELAQHIIDGINGASKGKDMRALQFGAVKAGNLADAADQVAKGALPKNVTPSVQGLSPADAAKLLVHAHTGGMSAIPGIALGAAKNLAGGGEKLALKGVNAAESAITSKPGIAAAVALPQLLGAGVASADTPASSTSSPGLGAGPVSSMVSSQANSVMQQANQATSQNNAIPQLTEDQINQILKTSGIEGLRSVEDSINTNLSIQKQESPELSTDQQGQIADISKSLQAVTDAATLYEQTRAAGAGTGALAVLGTKIPGIQNTKAEAALKTYLDNRGDTAAQIATVLGTGKSSATMIRQIESELPSATDSPQTAQAKFSLMISRLNKAMQSTLATPATNTPGQLTNFAGQTVPGLNQAQPDNLGLMNFIGAQ